MADMNTLQSIADDEAELAIRIEAYISWKLPPKDTEERMLRESADRAIARIAYEFQETMGNIILSVIKLEREYV